MSDIHILFIEDDRAGREMGAFNLRKAGYIVDAAASGEEGLAQFDPARHAVVITDVRMPGISGMDVLSSVRKTAPEAPVIVITAYADIAVAVEAMKRGANDFIGKPFNREHLLIAVNKALEGQRLLKQLKALRIKVGGVERPIIHQSDAMASVIEIADKVAPSDATVLVTGESGTGKELIARRIHVRSARAEAPFVPVNLAAMPQGLLEAELFGYEKGAFTGADHPRTGRLRHADGGTLFLDEVGEIPLELQKKLLRVLQERSIVPLGTDADVSIDVRVVAATNQSLTNAVAAGEFREDLFYRLNVVEIPIPPLRERREDIVPLARYFIGHMQANVELDIPDDIVARLTAHSWPGNVRELENTCQRLVLLSNNGKLSAADLPPRLLEKRDSGHTQTPVDDDWLELPAEGVSLIDIERRVIERVLALKDGNVTQAALFLQIPRHVLSYRMEKYGIPKKHR